MTHHQMPRNQGVDTRPRSATRAGRTSVSLSKAWPPTMGQCRTAASGLNTASAPGRPGVSLATKRQSSNLVRSHFNEAHQANDHGHEH